MAHDGFSYEHLMKELEGAKLDQTLTDGNNIARTYISETVPHRILTIGKDKKDEKIVCMCSGTKAAIRKCADINPKFDPRQRIQPDFKQFATASCREKMEATLRMAEKGISIPDAWKCLIIHGIIDETADIRSFTKLGYEVVRTSSSGTIKIRPTSYSLKYTNPVQLGAAIVDFLEAFPSARLEFQNVSKR
jgi:hypothetical protein